MTLASLHRIAFRFLTAGDAVPPEAKRTIDKILSTLEDTYKDAELLGPWTFDVSTDSAFLVPGKKSDAFGKRKSPLAGLPHVKVYFKGKSPKTENINFGLNVLVSADGQTIVQWQKPNPMSPTEVVNSGMDYLRAAARDELAMVEWRKDNEERLKLQEERSKAEAETAEAERKEFEAVRERELKSIAEAEKKVAANAKALKSKLEAEVKKLVKDFPSTPPLELWFRDTPGVRAPAGVRFGLKRGAEYFGHVGFGFDFDVFPKVFVNTAWHSPKDLSLQETVKWSVDFWRGELQRQADAAKALADAAKEQERIDKERADSGDISEEIANAINSVCKRLGYEQERASVSGKKVSGSYRSDRLPKEGAHARDDMDDFDEDEEEQHYSELVDRELAKAKEFLDRRIDSYMDQIKSVSIWDEEKSWVEIEVILK